MDQNLSTRDQVHYRLLARAVDLHLWLWLCVLLVAGVAGEKILDREWLLRTGPWLFLLLALTLVIDAIVHGLFRTTPGRRWIGIAVHDKENRPLSVRQHLARNGSYWFSALACFIPPFYLFTFPRCYRRLIRGEAHPHDRRHGYRVTVKKHRWLNFALLVLTLESLLTITAVALMTFNLVR